MVLLGNQIDKPLRFEFIPIDRRVQLPAEIVQGHKAPAGNLAHGFAGGVDHGSVEVTLCQVRAREPSLLLWFQE